MLFRNANARKGGKLNLAVYKELFGLSEIVFDLVIYMLVHVLKCLLQMADLRFNKNVKRGDC